MDGLGHPVYQGLRNQLPDSLSVGVVDKIAHAVKDQTISPHVLVVFTDSILIGEGLINLPVNSPHVLIEAVLVHMAEEFRYRLVACLYLTLEVGISHSYNPFGYKCDHTQGYDDRREECDNQDPPRQQLGKGQELFHLLIL